MRMTSLLFSGLTAALAGGCLPAGGVLIKPAPADQTLRESVFSSDPGLFVSDKVLVLDYDGLIVNAEGGGLVKTENPVNLFLEKVDAAGDDPAVKAAVIRIDSPGGTVVGSQLMYDALQRLRRKKEKALGRPFPVVAMMMGTAASGGYYLAMAADEVHALPTTVTGSIGVIVMLPDLTGLMSKIGVEVRTVKSGPVKDAGSPFRKMTAEEEKYLQAEIVDRYYAQFLEVVARNRGAKLSPERLRELADGRVCLAEAALKNRLIDRVGSLEDAVERAAELAGLSSKKVVGYGRPLGWKNTIYAQSPTGGAAPAAGGTTVNLLNVNLDGAGLPLRTPQFLYLWQPGL